MQCNESEQAAPRYPFDPQSGVVMLVHSTPPSVVEMIVPPLAAARQVVVPGQAVPFRRALIPEVWTVQLAPPVDVVTTAPAPPSATQTVVLGHATLRRFCTVPVATFVQVVPPLLV